MQNPPVGLIRVGFVYAPGAQRSVAESDNLQQMLGDGLKVDELAGANVRLLLLTEYAGNDRMRIANASKAKQIPCNTVDIAAVQNGACAMGVRSAPRIEILVNHAAAAAGGTAFATVFRMLITEI